MSVQYFNQLKLPSPPILKKQILRKDSFSKTRAFVSKIFLKLTQINSESEGKSLQIFNNKFNDRNMVEVLTTIPYLISLQPFFNFISEKETENGQNIILLEFAWIFQNNIYDKNIIIKKSGEENIKFNLILNGTVVILDLIIEKQCLKIEDYLIYIIKLQLIKENNILNILYEYNKDIINIIDNNIENFCKLNYSFDFNKLLKKAIEELKKLGFKIFPNYDYKIPNLNSYFNAIKIKNNIKEININDIRQQKTNQKKYFYVAELKKIGELNKGRFFGDLSLYNKKKDNLIYICLEKTSIGFISKNNSNRSKIFILMNEKMKKIISSNFKFYYIFQNVEIEKFINLYSSFFQTRIYDKGEKLFSQGSIYEGVYILKNGEIKISTERDLTEIDGMCLSLQFSLANSKEKISPLTNEKILDDNNNIDNPIFKTKEYLDKSKKKEKIVLATFNGKEIIGLNEFYDRNTNLYYFDAEVTSLRAVIYYIPKNFFNELVGREKCVEDAIMQIVEIKAKFFIGGLKTYKEGIIRDIGNKLGYNYKDFINKNKTIYLSPKKFQQINKKKSFNNFLNSKHNLKININNNNNNNNIKLNEYNNYKKFDNINDNKDNIKYLYKRNILSLENLNNKISFKNLKKNDCKIYINYNKNKKNNLIINTDNSENNKYNISNLNIKTLNESINKKIKLNNSNSFMKKKNNISDLSTNYSKNFKSNQINSCKNFLDNKNLSQSGNFLPFKIGNNYNYQSRNKTHKIKLPLLTTNNNDNINTIYNFNHHLNSFNSLIYNKNKFNKNNLEIYRIFNRHNN